MKKTILLLVALFSFVAMEAQIATATILIPNTFGTIVSPTAPASIYKVTNDVPGTLLFKAPMSNGSKQDFVIKLDSVSGTHTNVAVAVYGQKSTLKGDWTQIGSTVNWVGILPALASKDTTITISNASYVYYQNFKFVVTGTGTGVTKLTTANLKLWLE
jgi:hypothetical protein